jgi:SanA protein
VLKNKAFMIFLLIIILVFLIVSLPRMVMVRQADRITYTIDSAPSRRAAVVFGAGLTASGRPTTVLKDRVATAVNLYQEGKVEKVLMSGDNRFLDYNEPGAMKAYAIELGMPEADIVLDYAGRRTYDTCYRASAIFGLDQVILVTQNFHLPRALYTCGALGLEPLGVAADQRPYRDEEFWKIRESIASLVAVIEVHLTRPEPVLGEKEPIFPVE